MIITELYVAIIVGMVVALIFTELTGVVPAGMIIPGYMALLFDSPLAIVLMIAVALISYVIVVHVLSKFMLLYGKRRMIAILATSLIVKLTLDIVFGVSIYDVPEISMFSVIVPAIIANSIAKQGAPFTVGSALLASAMTYGIMNIV